MRRLVLLLLAGILALTTASACSSTSTGTGTTIDTTDSTIIDVRTPAEYAEGHLEGAVNIDVSDAAAFQAGVADLDPSAAYVVYCRSGNRSAAATAQLTDLGFTDVTDAGGLQAAASATGVDIVST